MGLSLEKWQTAVDELGKITTLKIKNKYWGHPSQKKMPIKIERNFHILVFSGFSLVSLNSVKWNNAFSSKGVKLGLKNFTVSLVICQVYRK